MEIGEAINVIEIQMANNKEAYCNDKESSKNWKVIIDGIKGGKGDPYILADKMVANSKPKPQLGGNPPWDLEKCGPNQFPYQAHHLVPEKQLPNHKVCVWLTHSPKIKNKKYELSSDTNYDTNHDRNGKFMPFCSTTKQWISARGNEKKQRDICEEMMRRTGIQLHQGKHSYTDYGEDLEIESKGYKRMVDDLLDIVHGRTYAHIQGCDDCKKKSPGKIKVQPLEKVVDHMYTVSELLDVLIDVQRIWVSKKAYAFFEKAYMQFKKGEGIYKGRT